MPQQPPKLNVLECCGEAKRTRDVTNPSMMRQAVLHRSVLADPAWYQAMYKRGDVSDTTPLEPVVRLEAAASPVAEAAELNWEAYESPTHLALPPLARAQASQRKPWITQLTLSRADFLSARMLNIWLGMASRACRTWERQSARESMDTHEEESFLATSR